jgi:hypothetical protein
MPGGGIIPLVAYGAQNTLLSGNPDFTYFYKNYKKYSHFSQENITIPLEGPNELAFTNPIKLRAKIQRSADLVSDLYFTFRIPDIYCKYISPDPTVLQPNPQLYNPVRPLISSINPANPPTQNQFNFQWSRYLGARIIQSIGFYVGGQKIQEFDSEYIIAKALLDLDQDAYYKWQRLVGDVPELYNPSQGIYSGKSPDGTQTGYPLVREDGSGGQNNNNPSIPGRDIVVPIPFWFCQNPANSLPLIALQYHECEVQITLRPIQELYQVQDPNVPGVYVAPGNQLGPASDLSGNLPVYIPANDSNPATGETMIDGTINLFAVDYGYSAPVINSWFLNPRIQVTYTYLTDDERKIFANQALSYLIYQTTPYPFPGIYNTQQLEIQTHNPINRFLIVPRRSDTLQFKNDVTNYTNWWNFPEQPFIAAGNLTNEISTGMIQVARQDQIIRNLRILMDGNEIQEQKPLDYFTQVTPWKNLKGGSIQPQTNYLPVYSFELEGPSLQPSGSVNTSKVRLVQIEVDPWPLPQPTLYLYNLNIYAENINWFEVAGGMGGLKWSL